MFLLETFANVISVRMVHMATYAFERRPAYKVDCWQGPSSSAKG